MPLAVSDVHSSHTLKGADGSVQNSQSLGSMM